VAHICMLAYQQHTGWLYFLD